MKNHRNVMPAKAGTHDRPSRNSWGLPWIPAFAGMTAMLLSGYLQAEPMHVTDAELHVDPAVCQQLIKHVPDASVEYQAGVDVDGNAVAPADINDSPLNKSISRQIVIHLTNQTAKLFGIAQPSMQVGPDSVPLAEAETDIGYITLRDGRPLLNGEPLNNDMQDELVVLCNQQKSR